MPPGTVLGAAGNIYATVDPAEVQARQAGKTATAPNPHAQTDLPDGVPDTQIAHSLDVLLAGIRAAVYGQVEVTGVHTLDARTTVITAQAARLGQTPLQLSVFAERALTTLRILAVQVAGRCPAGDYVDVYCTDTRYTRALDPLIDGFLALQPGSAPV